MLICAEGYWKWRELIQEGKYITALGAIAEAIKQAREWYLILNFVLP